MKRIDLKKVLTGLAVVSIVCVMPVTAFGQEKTFPVKVKYVEGDKVVPNTVIYFAYWDEVNSKLVEKSANTGEGKTVTFNVPFGEKGNTYPFVVLLSANDLETVKKSAGSGIIRAYRIPPDADCEYIEMEMIKGGGVKNNGCSIQMWTL